MYYISTKGKDCYNWTFYIVLRLTMDWFLLCCCNTTRASRNYDYKPTFLFYILTTLFFFFFNSVLITNTICFFYNLYILIVSFGTETYVPISWTTEPILSNYCYFNLLLFDNTGCFKDVFKSYGKQHIPN